MTIHTLRHELGGGGAEHLTRGLWEWRQRRREEARLPIEQVVSLALKTALIDGLRRERQEAMQEEQACHAEEKAYLDVCLTELCRMDGVCNHLVNEKTAIEPAAKLRGEKAVQAQQSRRGCHSLRGLAQCQLRATVGARSGSQAKSGL